jgi:hypothetical protein
MEAKFDNFAQLLQIATVEKSLLVQKSTGGVESSIVDWMRESEACGIITESCICKSLRFFDQTLPAE